MKKFSWGNFLAFVVESTMEAFWNKLQSFFDKNHEKFLELGVSVVNHSQLLHGDESFNI